MYASRYVFGKSFFTAWLVIAIVWLWGTLVVAGFYPVVDGRHQLLHLWRALRRPRSGKPEDFSAPSRTSEEKTEMEDTGARVGSSVQ